MRTLLRILACAYGLAALAAITALATGQGLAVAVTLIWVGGAVLTVSLAVQRAARGAPTAPVQGRAERDENLAEALRLWERDRLVDSAEPAEVEALRRGA